jgi:flagellar biosynthetic protein FliR
MTADIFSIGFRFAAPIIITLIVTTAVLGIIARTAPQLNIFMVGMPLRIGLGFLLIVVCLPQLFTFFEGMMLGVQHDVYRLIYLMS